MAWTATVKCDADKTDVGTATGVWNAGQADEFTYSKRIKLTHAQGAAFAAEAEAARIANAAVTTRNTNLSTLLQGKFDAL